MERIKHLLNKILPIELKALIRKYVPESDTSQHGEFLLLNELVKKDFPQFLVDVGAHDGRSGSNSYPFIKQGWKAIMIEPLPKVFELLSERFRENKNVICVNKACSNITGSQRIFLGSDGDTGFTSTLCNDDNEWFKVHRTDEAIDIEVDTLTNILIDKQFPRDFSLLLIDTEGMDYEVICGLDFKLFQPRIIVTEEYKWNREKHNSKYQLLSDRGYTLQTSVGCNTIWIRNELL